MLRGMSPSTLHREVTEAYVDQQAVARSDLRHAFAFLRRAPRLACILGAIFLVGGTLSLLGVLRADTFFFRVAGAGFFWLCAAIAIHSAVRGFGDERVDRRRLLDADAQGVAAKSSNSTTSCDVS